MSQLDEDAETKVITIKEFTKPKEVKCQQTKTEDFLYEFGYTDILVVCVKYGTKYGADYVNKLYYGVKSNLNLPHSFACFTEDSEGLDPSIKVIALQNHWQGWWSKVNIFNGESYREVFESLTSQSELKD